jgi:hypothetical protein
MLETLPEPDRSDLLYILGIVEQFRHDRHEPSAEQEVSP